MAPPGRRAARQARLPDHPAGGRAAARGGRGFGRGEAGSAPRPPEANAMSILLSLSPFAVFFLLMRGHSPLAGLVGAFAVSLLLCVRMRGRGQSLKILEVGSLVVFGALAAYTVLAAPAWTVATVRLAVDSGLLAIVLVSLAIGRPFTLQYAREQVPEQFWALPVFFTTNRRITVVWASAFAVLVATDVA